ncbi:MAG: glycosyltransferase family 2 protein [Rhodospirillaceae bacterium]|jgi:rSAM/selenodomain-associated transferase 2|nr:glycosyltransferase family 2 protein [Rhodospirillaceae bacterium]MBT6430259.1 glycosyltransferase family 2 protein [Rhodospirillaceae bacterium]
MKISVIIPTLDEAATLPASLAALAGQDVLTEIIVCDGGSTDGTLPMARQNGALVLSSPRGRGQQLHAGVARATGDVLLFLHADTILAPGALGAVRTALADPSLGGGNFRVIFDGPSAFAGWLTGFYAWLRRNGFYYGDSVVFMRRSVFSKIGGIKPIALMEDYDLTRRLERHGPTICIADPPVVTSSRRFDGRKPWRIFTQWVVIHALFHLRVNPDWLATLYKSTAHKPAAER